jgi:hypothetical protein
MPIRMTKLAAVTKFEQALPAKIPTREEKREPLFSIPGGWPSACGAFGYNLDHAVPYCMARFEFLVMIAY